jgi:hypothetical protein
MRRLKIWLLIAAALTLVLTGAAVAKHRKGKTHTDAVTTALAATGSTKSKTWMGEDGPYQQFHGRWTGRATGDRRLAGTLNLHASGLIKTDSKSGQVTGWLRIRGERSGAKARFWAVYSAGELNGFVVGSVHDKMGSATEELSGGGRLLGTLTGSLATTGTWDFASQITPANIQGWRHHRWKHR